MMIMMRVTLAVASLTCWLIAEPSHGQQATATEVYTLRERCAKMAAAVFQKDYTFSDNTGGMKRLFNYENHYSQKQNRCFFLEMGIFIEKGKVSKQLRLLDLHDNKEYGTYFDTDAQPQYVLCTVGEQRCNTEQEWRQLTKPYLED